jgi:Cof subfamily protein (haloacid dehalogenase superfamily)
MNKKLYVTDLDGTLLNSNMALSDYSVEILNQLIDIGINITFSTSRSFYTTAMILKKVRFSLPCITFNGAYVISSHSGKIIKKNLLDYEIYKDIFKLSNDMGLIPYVFGKTSNKEEKLLYDIPCNSAQIQFIQERKDRHDKRLHEIKNVCDLEEIINLNFLYPCDEILSLKEIISDKYNSEISTKMIKDIYNDGYFMLEISNKQANKGDMLIYISNLLGIDLINVTVFGDQSNDLDMFKIAGTKVAVKNANDKLKKYANIIVDSNDNDGVSRYLANLWNV